MSAGAAPAILLALAAATGCTVRASIPPPERPLAATPAEALPAAPPPPLEEAELSMRLVRRELDNGFTILVARGEPNGVASVVFVDRAAARWDESAPDVLTETAVGAMFRATRGADGEVVDDLLEREGFSPQVELRSAGLLVRDRIVFEELPRYLDALDRSLREPVFREGDLARVLDARIERLEGYLATPDGVIDETLPGLLYRSDDPRAASLEGRVEGLRSLEPAALAQRHAALLDPSRCAIVIAGDVEPLGALPLVRERFGAWPARAAAPRVAPPRYRDDGPRAVVIRQRLVRTFLKLVEHGPPLGHDDYPAFLVLEQLLGGMFGARLNLLFREGSGISYGFHARYAASATEGELEMVTAVDPSATEAVVTGILAELRRVRGEGVGVRDFELGLAKVRARERLLADLDGSAGLATAIGVWWLAGRDPEELMQLPARIDALDAEAVEAAARRWLRPDRAPLVAVGGPEVVDALRRAGAGTLRVLDPPRRRRR